MGVKPIFSSWLHCMACMAGEESSQAAGWGRKTSTYQRPRSAPRTSIALCLFEPELAYQDRCQQFVTLIH